MITKNFTVSYHKRNISTKLYAPDKELYPIVIFSHGFNGCGDDRARPCFRLCLCLCRESTFHLPRPRRRGHV